jgi:hypothetical protein
VALAKTLGEEQQLGFMILYVTGIDDSQLITNA